MGTRTGAAAGKDYDSMKVLICIMLFIATGCHRQQLAEDAHNLDRQCTEWFSWCTEHDSQACEDRVIAYCSEERGWIREQMQAEALKREQDERIKLEREQQDREDQQEREARGDTFRQRLGRAGQALGCSLSGNCIQIVNDPVHCTIQTIGNRTETYCH